MTTTENTILELHKIGNKETKERLEQEFPSLFTKESILQQAIEYLGAEDEDVIMLNNLEHIGGMNHVLIYQKLVVITKFKNKRHIFDWSDVNEPKYYPHFYMDEFRLRYVHNYYHCSSCSARLCLKSRELVKELCKDKEVLALYEQYFKQ